MKKILFSLLAVILIVTGCGAKEEQGGYETVDIDKVQALQDNGAIVVDVREPSEFAAGHIIDAINLPLTQIQKGNRDGLSKDKSYVIICQSGNRSIEASNFLSEDEFDVTNVSEGMSSWTGETEN